MESARQGGSGMSLAPIPLCGLDSGARIPLTSWSGWSIDSTSEGNLSCGILPRIVPRLQWAVPLRYSPVRIPAGSVVEPVPSPFPWIPTPLPDPPDPRRRCHGVARLQRWVPSPTAPMPRPASRSSSKDQVH